MHVLLDVSAIPGEPTGVGRYVGELVTAMVGVDDPALALTLLARRGDAARWERLAAGGAGRVAVDVVGRVPARRPVRLAWEQLRGPRMARACSLDVWHGPHYTIPLGARVPRVVTVHDVTLIEHPEWHERSKALYFGRMIPAALARASVCICDSRHTAARLDAVVPRRGSRAEVVVIPLGVEVERFRPSPDEAADRVHLERLGVRAPYLAFLGTIEPRKNVPALVEAFARVAGEHPDLQLVIAGTPGWDGGAVDAAIARSGVASRVLRTGYVDDVAVPPLLRRAAAVVYPSFEEGFGLPALEAIACGAPLVTTSGSSVEEFVGDAAVMVPPGDVDALAAGVRHVLDPDVGARLARLGPAQAARFTWSESARAHVAAYRHAAERGARP